MIRKFSEFLEEYSVQLETTETESRVGLDGTEVQLSLTNAMAKFPPPKTWKVEVGGNKFYFDQQKNPSSGKSVNFTVAGSIISSSANDATSQIEKAAEILAKNFSNFTGNKTSVGAVNCSKCKYVMALKK